MGRPTFLDLPERPQRPRPHGLTMVIDGGLPLAGVATLLPSVAEWIDVWKMGWGSAYLDPAVTQKLAMLAEYGIVGCTGGTLLELATRVGRADECLEWAAASGFRAVEVSNGLRQMTQDVKSELIARAGRDFTVLAEVGAKDPTVMPDPFEWVAEIRDDLAAGASLIVTEGRESGTVGLFEADGSTRIGLFDAIVDAADPGVLAFEAPRRDQQAWFIGRLGPNVNLANVLPHDVLGLEALRLGLRADTAHLTAPVSGSGTRR